MNSTDGRELLRVRALYTKITEIFLKIRIKNIMNFLNRCDIISCNATGNILRLRTNNTVVNRIFGSFGDIAVYPDIAALSWRTGICLYIYLLLMPESSEGKTSAVSWK